MTGITQVGTRDGRSLEVLTGGDPDGFPLLYHGGSPSAAVPFALIDDAPRPDVTISLLRVDGDPTLVLRRLIAQVNAVIPDANLVEDDLSQYCRAEGKRITGCTVSARGATADDRDIRITITADPGDVATRTAYPASESPAFPWVGTASRESPSAFAIETVIAMPRSLNESVGLAPNPA